MLESLQALISNDPTDAMNPIFQDILDQYINVMNMNEEQLTIHAANMGLHDNNSLWFIKVFTTKSLFIGDMTHFLYAFNVQHNKCFEFAVSTDSIFLSGFDAVWYPRF